MVAGDGGEVVVVVVVAAPAVAAEELAMNSTRAALEAELRLLSGLD